MSREDQMESIYNSETIMKKLYNIPGTVVHLPTREAWYEYMAMCEEAGWRWRTGRAPTDDINSWITYGPETCVTVYQAMAFGSRKTYQANNIITLNQLKEKLMSRKDQMESIYNYEMILKKAEELKKTNTGLRECVKTIMEAIAEIDCGEEILVEVRESENKEEGTLAIKTGSDEVFCVHTYSTDRYSGNEYYYNNASMPEIREFLDALPDALVTLRKEIQKRLNFTLPEELPFTFPETAEEGKNNATQK